MSPLVDAFHARLAAEWPVRDWQDVTVLLAVSGGADSVALLRAARNLKTGGAGRLLVAHLHHGLRGPDADADARFVARLAADHGLPCVIERADAARLAAAEGDGLEAAAREARYDFLTRQAALAGARLVAVAHHADDQAETILHRLLRGTGPDGLAGMPAARPLGPAAALVRPLLGFRRAELIAYLQALGQTYRQDASNSDLRFTRNRLRHELLPHLAEAYNPRIVEALVRLGRLSAERKALVADRMAEEVARRCKTRDRREATIDCQGLSGLGIPFVRELLTAVWIAADWPRQAMTADHWQALAELALCPAGTRDFPGFVRAEASGQVLRIWRTG